MKTSMRDIRLRLKYLSEGTATDFKYQQTLKRATELLENNGSPNQIIRCIEFGTKNNCIYEETLFGLFDMLGEVGTASQIRYAGNIICNEWVSKARDAKEAQTYLKQKLGRITGKVTNKVYKNIKDAMNAVNGAVNGAKKNFANNTQAIKNAVAPTTGSSAPSKEEDKEEAVKEAYEKMYEMSTRMYQADRIIKNYDKFSKRFNIDKLIQENAYVNGIDDTVISICGLMETYNIPDEQKFSMVIENCWYGFNRNAVEFDLSEVATTATDYYLTKGGNSDMCRRILENSLVVDKKDYKGDLELITEEEPEDDDDIQFEGGAVFTGTTRILRALSEVDDAVKKPATSGFMKELNDYKTSDEKNKETKLQWLVRKLYTKKPEQIIEGTPNLLAYIRKFFILGICAINPVIAAVALMADIFVGLHMEREETKKMIDHYNKEIDITKKKLETTKDKNEKERLEKYLEALKEARKKIDEYYEGLLSDEELDKKYDEENDYDDDDDFDIEQLMKDAEKNGGKFDDEDWDFDDDEDWDFDDDEEFEESAKAIVKMARVVSIIERMETPYITEEMCIRVLSTLPSLAETFVDISKASPSTINPNILESSLSYIDSKSEAKTLQLGILERYNIKNALADLRLHTPTKSKPNDIFTELRTLAIGSKVLSSVIGLNTECMYKTSISEASFTNNVKLAAQRLKKAAIKLSDKEKSISKTIDASTSNFTKAAERSLTNDNREAVIRGSILPSASKCIKAAIAAAGTAVIFDPVIAVIGVLGYLGVSKKYKAKERQLIIDELESELKICEKNIEIAERKEDMDALRQLYRIQKELERQRQRIKYKMKVDFGQTYHSTDETLGQ